MILFILAIWFGVGFLTALIISLTSDETESVAGLICFVILLGPLAGVIIAIDAFHRWRNRKSEATRPYTYDNTY